MKDPATQQAPRQQLVADAAMRVLAEQGARGLSHGAVDGAAGLPRGSTSNYFNSRDALLTAVLDRTLTLDTPPRTIARADLDSPLSRAQTRELILAAVDRRLDPERRHILLARYELFLESTRRPEFRESLVEADRHFVGLLTALLDASGCSKPSAHASELLAAIDGSIFRQLTFADSAPDRAELEETVDRMLATC